MARKVAENCYFTPRTQSYMGVDNHNVYSRYLNVVPLHISIIVQYFTADIFESDVL